MERKRRRWRRNRQGRNRQWWLSRLVVGSNNRGSRISMKMIIMMMTLSTREVAARKTRKARKKKNTPPALLNRKNKNQSLNLHRHLPLNRHHQSKRPLYLPTSIMIQKMNKITILLHLTMISNINQSKTLKTPIITRT